MRGLSPLAIRIKMTATKLNEESGDKPRIYTVKTAFPLNSYNKKQ